VSFWHSHIVWLGMLSPAVPEAPQLSTDASRNLSNFGAKAHYSTGLACRRRAINFGSRMRLRAAPTEDE